MQNTFDSGTAESKMGELNKSQQQQLLFHLQEVAKIHTLHGQFEVAAQLYRDMLTVSPHSTDFNLAAAHCYFQLNRLFLAMNFYQIADECSPKSDRQQYDINVCLGLTYKGLQKFE
jgi:tetratricopeptide (TPR) repeat protein